MSNKSLDNDEINLSIVIPHYNIPTLLDTLLSTIPKREDFQIIVVDDNSTKYQEAFRDVIKKHRDKRVEVYSNTAGKNGPGLCRNLGLDHAVGKWILFIDADDYFLDNWVSAVSFYFDSLNDAVYFPPTSLYIESGSPANRHIGMRNLVLNYHDDPSRENELRLRFMIDTTCSAIYRREFLLDHNIRYEDSIVAEDMMFPVMVGAYAERVACDDRVITCWTAREGSLTFKADPERVRLSNETSIRRHAFILKSLSSKEDLAVLEKENFGIALVISTIANGYGIKDAFRYIGIMKKENVPILDLQTVNFRKLIASWKKSLAKRIRKILNVR